MNATLIATTDAWSLWAALALCAWAGVRLERTRLGSRISGVVITMIISFALSNTRVIPADAPTYGVVWSFLVPLAIPLLLLRADLRRILREAGPTLLAFAAGAVGTVAGTILATVLMDLGPEEHKLAGVFCATYIGGSINYAGAAEALGLRDGTLLSAGIAADNLMMTLYFLVLFALPSWPWLRGRFRRRVEEGKPGEVAAGQGGAGGLDLSTAASALALATTVCAVGYFVESMVKVKGAGILTLTALTVGAATFLPGVMARLARAELLGMLLMQVFFAVIGASANVAMVLRVGPVLFVFAGVILSVHLATVLLAGQLFRLDLAEVVVASNANMGGPTTAAAMAAGRRWTGLVVPAILCGTLGYSTATFVGVAVGHLLG